MHRALLIFFLLLTPSITSAAVMINEVAWMGSANSANDEWIELFNDGGSAVAVDGWTVADGMNLSVALSGTIPAGSYAVLERTDDTSASGSAFMVYTGALTNTGATLQLIRDDGGIEDQVAGGENWENIGGDNATKETAQYTSGGWVTAVATPGRQNSTESAVAEDVAEAAQDNEQKDTTQSVASTRTSTNTKTSSNRRSQSTKLELPDWTLDLTLTGPEIAYVHQPVTFSIEPSGLSDTLLASVQHTWNMGDLTVNSGREVTHQYQYPGTYVVVASGEFKRHSAEIRHEITVLPVSFSITRNADGDVQIHNDSRYEVDLSGYSVRGGETLVLPDNSIVLPNATLTIPKERLGGTSMVWFMDQAHMVVASTQPTQVTTPEPTITPVAARWEALPPSAPPAPPAVAADPEPRNDNFRFADEIQAPGPQLEVATNSTWQREQRAETQELAALVNQANPPIGGEKLPYLALIGVLSLGILALFATRVR